VRSVSCGPSQRRLYSSDGTNYTTPRTKTKFGERAFSVVGPFIWNSLPEHIRSATNKHCFCYNKRVTIIIIIIIIIRLLVSDESYAAPSTEGLAKLRLKHPPATIDATTMPMPQSGAGLSVSEIDVRKAIMSFPAGSSAGPDGLRQQHLKDLVICQKGGSDLLTALTGFVNIALSGHCLREVAPYRP